MLLKNKNDLPSGSMPESLMEIVNELSSCLQCEKGNVALPLISYLSYYSVKYSYTMLDKSPVMPVVTSILSTPNSNNRTSDIDRYLQHPISILSDTDLEDYADGFLQNTDDNKSLDKVSEDMSCNLQNMVHSLHYPGVHDLEANELSQMIERAQEFPRDILGNVCRSVFINIDNDKIEKLSENQSFLDSMCHVFYYQSCMSWSIGQVEKPCRDILKKYYYEPASKMIFSDFSYNNVECSDSALDIFNDAKNECDHLLSESQRNIAMIAKPSVFTSVIKQLPVKILKMACIFQVYENFLLDNDIGSKISKENMVSAIKFCKWSCNQLLANSPVPLKLT